jgi:hypothetical protein
MRLKGAVVHPSHLHQSQTRFGIPPMESRAPVSVGARHCSPHPPDPRETFTRAASKHDLVEDHRAQLTVGGMRP